MTTSWTRKSGTTGDGGAWAVSLLGGSTVVLCSPLFSYLMYQDFPGQSDPKWDSAKRGYFNATETNAKASAYSQFTFQVQSARAFTLVNANSQMPLFVKLISNVFRVMCKAGHPQTDTDTCYFVTTNVDPSYEVNVDGNVRIRMQLIYERNEQFANKSTDTGFRSVQVSLAANGNYPVDQAEFIHNGQDVQISTLIQNVPAEQWFLVQTVTPPDAVAWRSDPNNILKCCMGTAGPRIGSCFDPKIGIDYSANQPVCDTFAEAYLTQPAIINNPSLQVANCFRRNQQIISDQMLSQTKASAICFADCNGVPAAYVTAKMALLKDTCGVACLQITNLGSNVAASDLHQSCVVSGLPTGGSTPPTPAVNPSNPGVTPIIPIAPTPGGGASGAGGTSGFTAQWNNFFGFDGSSIWQSPETWLLIALLAVFVAYLV